jgi:signal transduction histidine kinase
MDRPLRARWDLRWIGPSPTISIAVLVVWTTIAYDAARAWLEGSLFATSGTVGLGAIAAFAVFFVAANVRIGATAHLPRRRLFLLLEAPTALLVLWELHNIAYLALLVIVAAQLAHSFSRASAVLWLVAINAVLAWLLARFLGLHDGLTTWMLFGGFQVFAFLTAGFAVNARTARDELLRANGELLSTRHLLQESTRVGERLRLSRELHDVMGHKLMALKLQLRQLARHGPPDANGSAAQCSALADELLRDVRGVVSALRNEDGIDLHQSLAALAQGLPNRGIELKLERDVRVPQLDQAGALLRCAQEGLTNALRHSEADRIVLSLGQSAGGVMLCVEDNGRGAGSLRYGNGLTGMQERLELLGGRLEVAPGERQGLVVRAWLP